MAQDAVDFLLEQHEHVRAFFSQVDEGPGPRRAEAFDAVVRLLAVHETAEEEVVYPVARGSMPEGDAMVAARQREENEAKKELAALEAMGVENPQFMSRFRAFREKVLAHAQAEERELFPQLRQHVAEEQLATMRHALVAAEATAPTHPHAAAPVSAVGNIVVGPFVAIVDRLRDLIRSITKDR
jgi:hemerythrin superfamily protein